MSGSYNFNFAFFFSLSSFGWPFNFLVANSSSQFVVALDHGKALVYEHSKRLLINLIIVLVCRGNHVTLAQSLFNFITISEQGLGKHGLLKSSWTLDVGNLVGVSGPRAGAGTGTESVDGNIVSAGAGKSG